MGLDFIELIFQTMGRGVCWTVQLIFRNDSNKSDATHEVVGFFLVIFLIISILVIVGAANA